MAAVVRSSSLLTWLVYGGEGIVRDCMGLLWFSVVCFLFATTFYTPCDAARVTSKDTLLPNGITTKLRKVNRHLEDTFSSSYPYGGRGYVGSPFTMPPYDDVMGSPPSSPLREPIYCVYPPPHPPFTTTPPPPSTTIFSPPPIAYYSPFLSPNPPKYSLPPPRSGLTPPNPNIPSPPQFVPGPPIFQPPVVYPPSSGFPPPSSGSGYALWCVAKPSVPDPIILEAMNYACGSGADCDSIKTDGPCYEPNTLITHASFAFNSYWQRTRVAGATCDFGGTAMLVTKDPSFDGCKFLRT